MEAANGEKLGRVLAAALGAHYYRPWLTAAALNKAERIVSSDEPSRILRRLPPLAPGVYLGRREQFRSSLFRISGAPELRHPLFERLRVAVLAPWFRPSRRVRTFLGSPDGALARFRPHALAGPLERIEQLLMLAESGACHLPALTHAVIVLVHPDRPLLVEVQRARLWDAFQVPVYQLVVGFDGQLLAWECEAHDGLHVHQEHAIIESLDGQEGRELLLTSLTDCAYPMLRLRTPWAGALSRELCGCGQPGERILTEVKEIRARPAPPTLVAATGATCDSVVI